MDSKFKKNSIAQNEVIQESIDRTIKRDGLSLLIFCSSILLCLVMCEIYAQNELQSAGGVFEVPTHKGTNQIETAFIVDRERYFYDRVALIQDASAKYISSIFNNSSSDIQFLMDKIKAKTTHMGEMDVIANINEMGLIDLMNDKKNVYISNFVFTKGVPLVVDFEPKSENLDYAEELTFTVEIKGRLIVTNSSKIEIINEPKKFNIDIHSQNQSYRIDSFQISRMSAWVYYK